MERNLENVNTKEAKETTSDIFVFGKPDEWKLISKASSKSQGWMKSTKAMKTGVGVLVQCETEFRNPETGLVIACSQSQQFMPGVFLDKDGEHYVIV